MSLVQTASDLGQDDLLSSYRRLVGSFRRSLLAQNKSPRTVQTYGEALTQFGDFLASQGMPQDIAHIRREHVEAFIAFLLERYKPATASNRYRGIRAFFGWCVEEGEITRSPMEHMRPPAVPETPPAVLTEADLKRLLKVCSGKPPDRVTSQDVFAYAHGIGLSGREPSAVTVGARAAGRDPMSPAF